MAVSTFVERRPRLLTDFLRQAQHLDPVSENP
jgi:hypothetical protein